MAHMWVQHPHSPCHLTGRHIEEEIKLWPTCRQSGYIITDFAADRMHFAFLDVDCVYYFLFGCMSPKKNRKLGALFFNCYVHLFFLM